MNDLLPSFLAAILFYTAIALPAYLPVSFKRIARWLGLIGLLIGGLLGLVDFLLGLVNVPLLTRAGLTVALWIYVTGGLHLDGVIDVADGLALGNPDRRLEAMKDSVTGAFGVMAGVVVILLKTLALSEISSSRWLALILAASWGRWGQLVVIALYPYLRPAGKGAFHRQSLKIPQDLIVGLIFILPLMGLQRSLIHQSWPLIILMDGGCAAIALAVGFWFNRQLGGHTGDTYGATVEWSEALSLCLLAAILGG